MRPEKAAKNRPKAARREWSPTPLELEAVPGRELAQCRAVKRADELFYNDIRPLADAQWNALGATQRPGVLVIEARSTFPRRAIPGEVVEQVLAEVERHLKLVLKGESERKEFGNKTDYGEYHFRISFRSRLLEEPAPGSTEPTLAGSSPRAYAADDLAAPSLEVPLPSSERILHAAQQALDQLVGELDSERERHAAKLQPVLNDYLRGWDDEQHRLSREQKDRPAEEIAQEKRELVEKVNDGLMRLGLALHRDGQPVRLSVLVDNAHRRGTFWLTHYGSKKPLAAKAYLSDLFDLSSGEPQLGLAPARREGLAEWRDRVRRRTSGPSEGHIH
jgi:hypothetical protein